MATVVNDRDVLLLGILPSQRQSNPPGSTILLTTNAPTFHVSTDGTTTPSYITVTAHLVGITGTVAFTASGATITDNHDNTATIAYGGMSGASASVTATLVSNGQTFTAITTITKVNDGAIGPPGPSGTTANQYAIAYLYQWSTSAPSNPVGTSTFDWASGTNTNYVGSDSANWKLTIPANPGAPNISLFVAAVQVSAAGGTLSSSVSYTSAVVSAWSKNGATGATGNTGASGVQSASPTVFQWAASIPAGPSGTATYTWADGTFGAAPTGWSLTAGNSPTPGMTLWAAKVQVTDVATNTTTSFNWTSAGITAVGYAGSNGGAGAQGASYVTAYCASATATTTTAPAQTTGKTSLPATNDGGIVGTWSATVPALSSGQYMYQSDGIYDPTTNKVTWSIPYWSSLKVGSLSAISANLGSVTAGSININDKFTVSASGDVVAKSISIQESNGNVILQAGTPLPSNYVPTIDASKLGVTVGGDNLLNNSSFELQNTPTDYRPLGYAVYNNAGVSTSFVSVAGRTGGSAFGIRANATGATNWGLQVYSGDSSVPSGVQGGWQPNKTYVMSFKARKVNGASIGAMTLQWNTQPVSVIAVTNPTLSTSWQTYTFRITWGSSVEGSGRIFIDHIGSIATNDEIHIDELIVQEGDVYSEWFPSSREAKAAADTANATLANIASDNVLSKNEKPAANADWNTIYNERGGIVTQAQSLGVDSTDYTNKFNTLQTYISSLGTAFNDYTIDTTIVGTTFATNFTNYYLAKQALLNALAAKAATLASWNGVTGTGKPADNATVGATLGTNVNGQITSSNSPTLVGTGAINSVHISDLRTTNYAEDGSGNPTAGGKLASTGTAFKVAANSMQVGTQVLSDYWFRLLQGVDGNIANNRVIWRGNNDATTRGGAPNIACLSVVPKIPNATFTTNNLNQQWQGDASGILSVYHSYILTPTSYSGNTDNLDAMSQIHVQFFAKPTDTSPFTELYAACPSRTYDGATGAVRGTWALAFPFSGSSLANSSYPPASDPQLSGTAPNVVFDTNNGGGQYVYIGYLRIRVANSYGWSATQDFAPKGTRVAGSNTNTYQNNAALPTGTITGVAGSSGGGSGSQGGACPAPWVKVRLLNGKEVNAGDLHNGAKLAAVNDSTMEALPQGGIVRDLATIWKQRYRVKLTDGTATEWSENHRFAVAERGWVQVQNLRSGDQILGLRESIVESVLAVGEGQVVSFRVEGAGTYFAGGLLCHNTKTIT